METLDEVFDFIKVEIEKVNEEIKNAIYDCSRDRHLHLIGVRDGFQQVLKRIQQYGAVM